MGLKVVGQTITNEFFKTVEIRMGDEQFSLGRTAVQAVCFDWLVLLDLFSDSALYELLTVIMQFGMFLHYLVYFLNHRLGDAYALPMIFSIDGPGHSSSKSSINAVL